MKLCCISLLFLSMLVSILSKSRWTRKTEIFLRAGYSDETHEINKIGEKTVFNGYRQIIQREFLLPNGRNVTYDILTQKHLSVVVFTWDTKTSTTTLVREFHPGAEKSMFGLVAGMYESKKHTSALESAQFELEEEAQLQSNQWIPLLQNETTSMSFDKYSTNRFFPYLALDCVRVENPKPMDLEEFILVERNVTYSRIMELMEKGEINVVSTYGILLGFKKLKELGIKYED